MNFYRRLFTSEKMLGRQFMRGCFPSLSDAAKRMLEAKFSMEETKRDLMGIGSLKASGPDRFQPIFFKAIWETTGATLYNFTQ